jgi:hypothetical protein
MLVLSLFGKRLINKIFMAKTLEQKKTRTNRIESMMNSMPFGRKLLYPKTCSLNLGPNGPTEIDLTLTLHLLLNYSVLVVKIEKL